MSEMIERVARELFVMFRSVRPQGEAWRDYEDDARTIIATMREPTEAMREAAAPLPTALMEQRNDVPGYDMQMRAAAHADQMTAHNQWQTMIDAALAD